MVQIIKCPHCQQDIELTQALTHQIEAQVSDQLRADYEQQLKQVRQQATQEALAQAKNKLDLEFKQLQAEAKEEKERSQKLTEQVSQLMKELRQARREREEDKLVLEKRLAEEEAKIRQQAKQQAQEEQELKVKEKDKTINDLKRALAEATRKAEQGSQQTQGEVLELEIEELLKKEFPTDQITEVKKGVRGADVTQVVIDKRGRECGTILWESKNAQWQNGWIPKLKQDAREARAHIAVLVATNPPESVKSYSYMDGVWVVKRSLIVALATTMRFTLVKLHAERMANVGREEKQEFLYRYVTSHEFRGRVEAIVEAFSEMQTLLEKEKRWFNAKWSKQEKQIRAVIDNTQGMYYDMQGITGKALPGLPSLELEAET